VALAAVLAVVVAVLVAVLVRGGSEPSKGQIAIAADGASLAALVHAPDGDGPFPLIVMPAGWGGDAAQYNLAAADLVRRGYVVVAYAQRGAGGSTGKVDLAGPATQRDVSTVISWALKHTHADAHRIVLMGGSYGAGVSLLAAENDKRVTAVVAMSGFVDAYSALFPGDTGNVAAAETLFRTPLKENRLAPDVLPFVEHFLDGDVQGAGKLLRELAASRSAMSGVAKLNARKVPVLLAGSYDDSVLAPGPLLDFYAELTGPKRLQLAAGDHGGPEWPGLLGRSDPFWTGMLDWLDHFARGVRNDAGAMDPVLLRDAATGSWHAYPDLTHLGSPLTAYLGRGSLALERQKPWSQRFTAGTDSGADLAPMQLQPSVTYRPASADVDNIGHEHAAVWVGPSLPGPAVIIGRPVLDLNVRTPATTLTLFAYLYDVQSDGFGTLITAAPYTIENAAPGKVQRVSMRFAPTAWTVQGGHHLSLVLDTVDPRFASAGEKGTPVSVSSAAGADAAVLKLRVN
jgi:predicted acyl esterase